MEKFDLKFLDRMMDEIRKKKIRPLEGTYLLPPYLWEELLKFHTEKELNEKNIYLDKPVSEDG